LALRADNKFMTPARFTLFALTALLMAGCEIPGVYPDPKMLQREADAKAIGGACRHALRGIEDCYTLNPKAAKAAVFAGWKDMDAYMRENKIEGVASVVKPVLPEGSPPPAEEAVATSKDKAAADPKDAHGAHGSKAKTKAS
jgi:hypothetical protein